FLFTNRSTAPSTSLSLHAALPISEEYSKIILSFRRGEIYDREEALHRLVDMQFTRNNMQLQRGTFRVRGDILEVQPIDEEIIIRDRKSTRLNSSHVAISYAVFCLK